MSTSVFLLCQWKYCQTKLTIIHISAPFLNKSLFQTNRTAGWIIQWLTHKDIAYLFPKWISVFKQLCLKSHTFWGTTFDKEFFATREVCSIYYWDGVVWIKSRHTRFAMLSLPCDYSIICIASLSFTTPLPWPHGIVKCPLSCALQNLARSSRSSGYFSPTDLWILHFGQTIFTYCFRLLYSIHIWTQGRIH